VTLGTTEPVHRGDERTALLGFLQRQRDVVAWKVGGASDEVLRSASTPTGLTAHGLVQHLANVERWWLRHEVAGETGLPFEGTEDDPRADLRVGADVAMADLLAGYAAEAALCDAVVEAQP